MRQASLSHFLLGQISLGVYRENNISNETIQDRHPHWRIIIFKEPYYDEGNYAIAQIYPEIRVWENMSDRSSLG